MADLELVEKLRERAHVTYDEAREALDACGDDLLDAVIYLEKKGKVPPPNGGSYTSKQQASGGAKYEYHANTKSNTTFSDYAKSFFSWLGDILKKSCVNMFEVLRNDRVVISVPVIALVVLVVFCFWVTLPLMIVGLFLDCRYRFKGKDTEKSGINDIIDNVADVANSLKNEMQNARTTHDKDENGQND